MILREQVGHIRFAISRSYRAQSHDCLRVAVCASAPHRRFEAASRPQQRRGEHVESRGVGVTASKRTTGEPLAAATLRFRVLAQFELTKTIAVHAHYKRSFREDHGPLGPTLRGHRNHVDAQPRTATRGWTLRLRRSQEAGPHDSTRLLDCHVLARQTDVRSCGPCNCMVATTTRRRTPELTERQPEAQRVECNTFGSEP